MPTIKQQLTICYKVDKCMKIVEKAVEKDELDVGALSNYLHQIRRDAQKMEDALKMRKSMMEKADIENLYQTAKGEKKRQGINNIPNEAQARHDKPQYELTIKNGDEVLYQNMVESGVLCAVEKLEGMDKDGHVNGQTQTFVFGNTVGWWFAFDQLRQGIEDKRVQVATALKQMAKNNELLDPEVRKKLLGL